MTQRRRKAAGDQALTIALKKSYTARAKLFFDRVREFAIEQRIATITQLDANHFRWELDALGITATAFRKIQDSKIGPHLIFCHPDVLAVDRAHLSYYRNLAALSQKGLSQLLEAYQPSVSARNAVIARALNQILSEIIDSSPPFTIDVAHQVILAELGTEIQGSWVNVIGRGAARSVEKIIGDYAKQRRYVTAVRTQRGKTVVQRTLVLKTHWKIVFASEPDVAVYDDKNVLKAAIEIKGSMDKAGAQTRYGEAKKSFSKALRENPRCETFYLASCFTSAVLKQIKEDGQVRKTFNLAEILADRVRQQEFLDELFTYVIRLKSDG